MYKFRSFMLRVMKLDNDIVHSSLHTEATFYGSFLADLYDCRRSVLIESPYITTSRVAMLRPVLSKLVKRGVVVTISTRIPSEHSGPLRSQACEALADLHSIGVDLQLMSGRLHRKIAMLDDQILWEGSLNILSQNNSIEIMRRTVSRALVRQMKRSIGYK